MKTYELLAILKPSMDQEEVDKFTEKLDATVTNLGGKTVTTDKAGRKRLPYEVKGYSDGYMLTSVMELPEEQVIELKRLLKLNDNIIRTMFVNAKKVKAVK